MKCLDGLCPSVDLSVSKLDIKHLSDGFINEKSKSSGQIPIHNSCGSV